MNWNIFSFGCSLHWESILFKAASFPGTVCLHSKGLSRCHSWGRINCINNSLKWRQSSGICSTQCLWLLKSLLLLLPLFFCLSLYVEYNVELSSASKAFPDTSSDWQPVSNYLLFHHYFHLVYSISHFFSCMSFLPHAFFYHFCYHSSSSVLPPFISLLASSMLPEVVSVMWKRKCGNTLYDTRDIPEWQMIRPPFSPLPYIHIFQTFSKTSVSQSIIYYLSIYWLKMTHYILKIYSNI